MSYTKFLIVLVIVTILTALSLRGSENQIEVPSDSLTADVVSFAEVDSFVDYDEVEDQLAELRRQLSQPNILKDDILRGWYMASESEKRYGTPDNWIFLEDGENSKWISPNVLEEEELIDNRLICEGTAGHFVSSCLDSTDTECEYVSESFCECSYGTKWKVDQGCILTNLKEVYVSINAEDLEKGWYFGLPNERKFNTPSNWIWLEAGRKSIWQKSN